MAKAAESQEAGEARVMLRPLFPIRLPRFLQDKCNTHIVCWNKETDWLADGQKHINMPSTKAGKIMKDHEGSCSFHLFAGLDAVPKPMTFT